MSFNPNDSTAIHLGNYEEYFILYMDNELNEDQKEMVEAFLLAHPDLQAELDMLMSTRLPVETISFNKEALLADSMKLNSIEEELLLYLDNELPEEKKKITELEIQANPSYRQQYQLLLPTRLDASETITYPYKKELYRRTERVVAFKLWMRIAAAAVVVAAMGVLYFAGRHSSTVSPDAMAIKQPVQPSTMPDPNPETALQTPAPSIAAIEKNPAGKLDLPAQTTREEKQRKETSEANEAVRQPNDFIAHHTTEAAPITSPLEKATTALATDAALEDAVASFEPSKQIINTSGVTNALSQRNTTIDAEEPTATGIAAANNERKGSFKSFLRKATRLIERKTGIDPTGGDDDELLIGAVAVKLK